MQFFYVKYVITKFTRKHLYESLRPATLLKKILWHRRLPENFAKFLRTTFYRTPLNNCFWICHWDVYFQNQPFTDVFQNRFFLKTLQYCSLFLIKLQVFFYRTPAVAASDFLRHQTLPRSWYGIYCWQSHRLLCWTPLNH